MLLTLSSALAKTLMDHRPQESLVNNTVPSSVILLIIPFLVGAWNFALRIKILVAASFSVKRSKKTFDQAWAAVLASGPTVTAGKTPQP